MAAAELKLQVGLDLAFFRQQLAQLGNVAIGYHMPINIKFSPIAIQQELSRLKKNIGKTQYTININTNLEAEIRNADRLVKALQRVQRESGSGRSGLPVDIRQLRKTKSQGGFSAADIKTLFNAAIEGGLLDEKTLGKTREQMVTAFASIGKDSIEGLLNGLSSADASIRAAAESIGATLITTTKASLGMRSPSKRFEEIGKNVGKGFENGVLSSMDTAFNALEQKMQQRMRALDTIARGIFHMLGMDPAAMMAAQRQKLLPPSISWPASAATPPSYQGKPGTMLPGAPAPTLIGGAAGPFGLLPRTTRAGAMGDMMRMLSQGADEESPGVLAKTTKARIDEIINKYLRVVEVQVGKSFDIPFELKKQLNKFSYLVQALRDAETRTAQMQMPTTKAIGGTAFGSQKYLPTALSDETKKVLRDAAHAFLNVMRQEMRAVVYQVGVQDLGNTIGRQAMLPGRTQAPLMLPAAGGTTPRSQMPLHAVSTGAYVGQPGFMQAPSIPPPIGGGGAPPAPPTPPGGGRGGFGSFGGFGGAMPNVSLPGAGLVREVGDQFGYAAQQVLLFGTTYKALAFLTDFPSKVGEAVAQLQSFRNTLQAITPNAEEFQKSNQFILDTVDKYNIPIQSARDGFTKLYASMEPAGFSGEQIQKLFLGISKASATLGLSSDKVDRVTYAFSQMASKGQLMSEEVSGQLGDVIPGALSIMAKAANMDIKTFKKSMEDGVFVGQAFTDVMSNVPIVLDQRFGKGAEGAAKTFQGQMNAMATATQMLYESFVPVGDLFTSKIVAPFTKGLQVLADGFNAFFSGAATKTVGGSALFQELEKLRPTFKGIADNIKQLLPILQSFATTVLGLGKILLQIAGNPFAGYLARIYLAVLPLTMAIQALNLQALVPMIASFVRAIPAFIAYQAALLQGVSANKSLQLSMVLTGQSAGITAGKIRLVGAALGSLAVGGIVLGIGVLIERFMSLGAAIDGVHQATKQTVQGISSLANTGDVGGLKNILADTKKQVETFKGLRQFVGGGLLGGPSKQLTQSAANQMKALGLERFVSNDVTGKPYVNDFINASKLIEEKLKGLEKAAGAVQEKLPLAGKIAESIKQQAKKASDAITPIAGAGGDKKKNNLESYYKLEDDLAKAVTQGEIDKANMLFEHRKNLMDTYYDLQDARANSFQKATIRFQREVANIEMERQKNVLNAQNNVRKAEGSVAGGAGGVTGLLQGSTGVSSAAHFDVRRQDGGYISPQQARALFDASVAKQLQLTSSYGPRRAPVAGASTFHRGVDLAGPANTPLNLAQGYSMVGAGMKGGLGYTASVRGPKGEMYDVGHLQRPAAGAGAARKVTGNESRDINAAQKTQIELDKENLALRLSNVLAIEKQEIAMKNYVAEIMPLAEQKLQNQLLAQRNQLQLSGAGDAEIEQKTKAYELDYKRLDLEKTINALRQKKTLTDVEAAQLKTSAAALAELNEGYEEYIANLAEARRLRAESSYSSNMDSLRKQLQLASILDPYDEQRQKYIQEDQSPEQADAQVQAQKQLDTVTKLRDSYRELASTIGTAFGDAFKGIITGSMTAQEALAGFFQNLSNYFADAVSKMIADWLRVEAINGLKSLLGGLGMFGGGGGGLGSVASNMDKYAPLSEFANGGIAPGGFRAFATGGIVTGPTLGLVGEGRYNEAVIPLPDGKSVPVDLGGEGARLGGNGGVSVGAINITVQNTGDTLSPAAQKQIAGQVQGIVLATMADQRRSGGLLR